MRVIHLPIIKALGRVCLGLALGHALGPGSARAGQALQTDWSTGAVAGPVTAFESGFASATGTSWMALPGQIALSSVPLSPGVEHLINDAYTLSFSVEAGDMDGDGDMDVVGSAEGADLVSVWYNEGGEPVAWTEQVVGTIDAADGLCVNDLDRDGDLDILATAGPSANRIVWWRNDGGTPVTWTRDLVGRDWPSAYEVSVADVDGDMDTDVISASWGLGTVAWWSNEGGDPTTWSKHTVSGDFAGAHSAHGADLDGDGDTDIVATCGVGHEVAWWSNVGGSPIAWTKHTIRSDFTGGRSVFPADIDRDGDLDVAGTAWTNEVTWWRNDGGDPLVWHEQVIDSDFNGGHSIRVSDLNGDGRPDIVAAAVNDGDIVWYGNQGGDPISWSRHVVSDDFTGAINVRSGDIDGDGDLDILGASYTLGEFTWWEVTEFCSAGELTGSILDLQEMPGAIAIDWAALAFSGTGLSFQTRCADDPEDMGEWSSPLTFPGVVPPPLGRYIQYRVQLSTTDATASPILTDLELSWSPAAGVNDADGEMGFGLRLPNPALAEACVRFLLPEAGPAELTLFDLNGRRIAILAEDRFPAGANETRIGGLRPGIYLCRLRAAGRESVARLIVVAP